MMDQRICFLSFTRSAWERTAATLCVVAVSPVFLRSQAVTHCVRRINTVPRGIYPRRRASKQCVPTRSVGTRFFLFQAAAAPHFFLRERMGWALQLGLRQRFQDRVCENQILAGRDLDVRRRAVNRSEEHTSELQS